LQISWLHAKECSTREQEVRHLQVSLFKRFSPKYNHCFQLVHQEVAQKESGQGAKNDEAQAVSSEEIRPESLRQISRTEEGRDQNCSKDATREIS
jgi:hypothetical protein